MDDDELDEEYDDADHDEMIEACLVWVAGGSGPFKGATLTDAFIAGWKAARDTDG